VGRGAEVGEALARGLDGDAVGGRLVAAALAWVADDD
jgi:hypothetical protein